MSQNILLHVKNFSVGYSEGDVNHVLFENIDLELHAGELVCFMGANGIGKSSLIRTIAGLQKPLSRLTPGPEVDPRKISVVLTDRVNAVNMTVEELVALGRYPYLDWSIKLRTEDRRIIEDSIRDTHIQNIRGKKLYELSDGQLQMAMIARALAQDTPVVLLDEPTAHLDLNNRVEIMNLLRNLARSSHKAILVATHELDLALQTADLIWLATQHRKIITGIPEDLVLNGSFDETFQFKGFDLKTGKVTHQPWRNKSVKLAGEGYEYLWTKNALERSGYQVTDHAEHLIRIEKKNENTWWDLQGTRLTSLSELLALLYKV